MSDEQQRALDELVDWLALQACLDVLRQEGLEQDPDAEPDEAAS